MMALENGEAPEALERFGEVVRQPDLTAFPDLGYEARWGYALALEACGRVEEAIGELEKIAASVSPEYDHDRWAQAYMVLCRCHRNADAYEAAATTGEFGLRRLVQVSERWTDSMVMLAATVLSVHICRGDLAYARQFAGRLIDRADEVGSVLARAAACWNAGTIAYYLGDMAEALRLEGRALALFGESDDPRNLARLNAEYGNLMLCARPSNAEQAKELILRAREQLDASSAGASDRAECDIYLARAEIALDRPEEAVRHAASAVERLAGSAWLERADALIILGYGMRRSGHEDEAAEALRKAEEQLSKLAVNRRAAQSWFELAELMAELDTFSESATTDAYLRALACVGL
jgi:tetratricopeptide (TPR) repeat protein